MTPTEQEIEFFKEAKRIQELWEPKPLDFVYDLEGNEVFCLAQPLIGWGPMPLNWIFVPRQGQLQEMLEERGYRWDVGKLPDSYTATAWNDDVDMECEGSTPSIALGKCLLEVLKEE